MQRMQFFEMTGVFVNNEMIGNLLRAKLFLSELTDRKKQKGRVT